MHNTDEEIRISDLLYVLFKHRILILALSLCGLVVGVVLCVFSYMRGEMARTYAVTSAIAVTSQTQDGLYTNKESSPNSTDITLAENMTESVVYVLRSDKTLNAAIRRLSLVGIGTSDIYNNLKLSRYGNTQIIEMTLYWRSAEEGVEILNAINAVAPSVLGEVLQIGNVSVVNDPKSQYRIGGSINATLWIITTLLGFLLGAGLSVCEYLFRPKLIVPEDTPERFGLPLLGLIPENKTYFSGNQTVLGTADPNLAYMDEAFVSLARTLKYTLREQKNPFLCLTATGVNEGKSSLIARLAYQLSELEYRVLLVDLDLQRPVLAGLFGEKADYYHSLNALYRGDCTEEEAVVHLTQHLDLLPTVPEIRVNLPLNAELCSLLRQVGAGYDCVLISTAPAGLSSDVAALHPVTDQVLYLIRRDTATLSGISKALKQLQTSGITPIGCVVNGVRPMKEKNSALLYQNRSGKKRKAARLTPDYIPMEETPAVPNRVVHNAGLDQAGLVDESISRSFEEYRSDDK